MAEKEGFEPSIPFWGIHDFQSCALGQLRDFSMRLLASCRLADDWDMIQHFSPFVKWFFENSGNYFSFGIIPQGIGAAADAAIDVNGAVLNDLKAAAPVYAQGRDIFLTYMGIQPDGPFPAQMLLDGLN